MAVSLKKLDIRLPCDTAIAHLGVDPRATETCLHKAFAQMSIAASANWVHRRRSNGTSSSRNAIQGKGTKCWQTRKDAKHRAAVSTQRMLAIVLFLFRFGGSGGGGLRPSTSEETSHEMSPDESPLLFVPLVQWGAQKREGPAQGHPETQTRSFILAPHPGPFPLLTCHPTPHPCGRRHSLVRSVLSPPNEIPARQGQESSRMQLLLSQRLLCAP